MGRGTDVISDDGRLARRRSIVDIVESKEVLQADLSGSVNGSAAELVHFKSGSLSLQPGEPANLFHGMALVESMELQSDGTTLVRFRDGEEALVDLSKGSVALLSGDDSDLHVAGALYSALAQRALNFPFASRPEEGEAYEALAKAFAHYQDNPGDPDAFRALALAARECGDEVLPGDISVNDPDLLSKLSPQEADDSETSIFDNLAQNWNQVHKGISKILNGPMPERAAAALLYQVNDDGTVGPSQEILQRNSDAADELAGGQPGDGSGSHLIPDNKIDFDRDPETGALISEGEYYVGPQEEEHFAQMRAHMEMNGRFAILAGPPGTGKDTFAEQVAAQAGLAFKQFNIGPDYDLEQALSGDIVGVETVYRDEWVEMRDEKTGKVILDDDGEPKMEKIRIPLGSSPVTKTQDGELTRWLKKPSVVVLDEPEGLDAQMVRLHSIAGDRVESSKGRFVTVNSVTGEEQPVHEDSFFFIAYNPGEGDERFRAAFHDRALDLAFEYYDTEIEAKILAVQVNNILKSMSNADDQSPLVKEWTEEELLPMAEVFVAAREAHLTNPTDFPGEVGRRKMARTFVQILKFGWEGHDDPVATAFAGLRFLTHQGGRDSLPERDKKIRDTISADQHVRLNEIAKWAASENPQNDDDLDGTQDKDGA